MTALEKARELAEAILQEEIVQNYIAAREAYENSPELQTKMTEYNTQRLILGQEFSKEVSEQSPELISIVRDRMEALAREISAMEEYRNLSATQLQVSDFMNKINGEIQRIVFGVEPEAESCTHDCSTCHASCSQKNN